ncbi:glycoside hydrolase [Sistotremastrum niveocremeum HHB9708]|uniref:glucan endo-1,3-beta-D-glucosidase n=1 Tax=Sistotremastrum niveocremeum HHB9708 TaxID=1314777 RepID=A0A164VHU9_9AGAM|nr:glycoside hydrolase [Sistotremastrum niveocremeum HHB9708]
MEGAGYSNLDGGSRWLEKEQARSRKSRMVVIGSIAGVAALIVAGIVIGVLVSKHHSSSSTSSSSSSKSSSSSGSSGKADPSTGFFAVVNQKDPNDPSTFEPDSALSNAFYGVAYTPFGSQIPDCGSNLPAVIEDIQLISQITTRSLSVAQLDAIQRTKVNMSVWLGNYVLPGDDAGYTRQRDEITTALKAFGTTNVAGITVGNEFMLNYLNANGGNGDPNSAVGNQGAAILNSKIADTRSNLKSLGYDNIPVGTADAGAYFNNEVLAAVDYGMANVHPWFANVSIDTASSWTTTFFQQTDIAAAQAQSNNPQMYIAETGWPTFSNDVGNESNGPSNASVPNLQTFVNDFVCSSNTGGINYFFFEVFDEPWKNATFGGVEGYWGLFNFNKTLKALTLPTCSHS